VRARVAIPFGALMFSRLLLGTVIYRRLRANLESDLGQRLVRVAQLMALGIDTSLVIQFHQGDERLTTYRLVQARLSDQAHAARARFGQVRSTLFGPAHGWPSRPDAPTETRPASTRSNAFRASVENDAHDP
jgi:hypothetical protein